MKRKVAFILREVHNHTSHFESKIVPKCLRFEVYWLKIAADVCENI